MSGVSGETVEHGPVDKSLHHVVMFSSGAGSAVAAKRVAERYGTDRLTLLFADVNMEHPDNYRFLREAHAWVGGELVILDNDGRTIWDVFKAQRFLGNTRVDLCSRVLKREPMRAWLDANCDPENTVVHLGFDISEEHRIARAAPHWVPWHVEAPLCWEPVVWKDQAIERLAAAGIEAPLLTRQGFPHANCGGGCVKAGIGQFTRLYHDHPDTYAEWERQEEKMRAYLGKDISILRDRRKVPAMVCPHEVEWWDEDLEEERTEPAHEDADCPAPVSRMVPNVRPLTLRSLRVRIEDERSLFSLLDADEGDSCNCMGDYADEVPVTIGLLPHSGSTTESGQS